MTEVAVARYDELEDRQPAYALVANVDFVKFGFEAALGAQQAS